MSIIWSQTTKFKRSQTRELWNDFHKHVKNIECLEFVVSRMEARIFSSSAHSFNRWTTEVVNYNVIKVARLIIIGFN